MGALVLKKKKKKSNDNNFFRSQHTILSFLSCSVRLSEHKRTLLQVPISGATHGEWEWERQKQRGKPAPSLGYLNIQGYQSHRLHVLPPQSGCNR